MCFYNIYFQIIMQNQFFSIVFQITEMGCLSSIEQQINRQVEKVNGQVNPNVKIEGARGAMEKRVVRTDDFLTHHLKHQIELNKYASTKRIRSRQILAHNTIASLMMGVGDNKSVYDSFLQKAWLQRIMMQIFIDADREFFQEHRSIDDVRFKIAERYLFQVSQMKQIVDAAMAKFSKEIDVTQIELSNYVLKSDSALYPALKFFKDKYPQVADNSNIKFPSVKQIKNDINLLDNFKSKSFSDPSLKNIQTLYSDLKFLIDRSVEQFSSFQIDMKAILGDDVLTDSKVKRIQKNGKMEYSASPVRRVLIKWAETLIERIPELILSTSFIQFINSKTNVSNNFYIRSTVQPTTHVLVIQYLLNLIQSSKYDIKTLQRNPKFGFFIYDLVRCKTKRNTGEEIVELLEKMIATNTTVSGKKFEVVRVKDRFKTPNRDLMVNFRYGDVLVGEAQLCIDTSDVSEKTKKTNKFNHYIYELERGLFGPTLELMMQYEDFTRSDISANLEAEGKVFSREAIKTENNIKKVERKCMNGHQMIQLVGNHFNSGQNNDYFCDYCHGNGQLNKPYHYCYQCTIAYCLNCQSQYKKDNPKNFQLLCYREDLIPQLKNEQQIFTQSQKNKSIIVLFYLNNQAASILYKDFVIMMEAVNRMMKKQTIPLYLFNCDSISGKDFSQKLGIKRFPTMIVFDRNGKPQTTIIGTSIYEFDGLVITQKNLAQGRPKCFQVTCNLDKQIMQLTNVGQDQQFNCYYCFGAKKEDNFMDYFNVEDRSQAYKCSQGHFRCLSCAYNASIQPCTFRDYRGRSYLSALRITPSKLSCKNGHLVEYVLENKSTTNELRCFKCKDNFIFSDEEGMGVCKTCNVSACPQCLSIEKESIGDKIKDEFVCQNVQSTAEEAFPCACGRLFKKVYNTRLLEEPKQKMEDQSVNFENLFESGNKWNCILCKGQFSDGNLHYACFICPFILNLHKQRFNIEICLKCASSSGLTHRKLTEKAKEEHSDFVCNSNHSMVRTTMRQSSQKLTYSCKFCSVIFYASTQRYHCKVCKIDSCLDCSPKNLKNTNPPICKNACENGHQLFVKQKTQHLNFCENCHIVLEDGHFTCYESTCDYSLCYQCAARDLGKRTY